MARNNMADPASSDLAAIRAMEQALAYRPADTTLKAAAISRGLLFGAAVNMTDINADADYRTLVAQHCSLLSPSAAFTPNSIQQVRGTFTNTKPRAFVAYADSLGLPFRWSAGLMYPAHDMDWVSDNDGTTINPILDGEGNPVINASNYIAEIDAILNYLQTEPWVGRCHSINVSNELIDPMQGDGWRRHPWYTAAGGPGWLLHLIAGVHSRWPNVPLGICQDLTEQQGTSGSYNNNLATTFLAKMEYLLSQGAAISYVDLQGHLTFARGYSPALHKTFLEGIKALGLKIIIGELDIRTGNTAPFTASAYSTIEYDRQAAYMVDQYLDTILPYVDSEIVCWGLSDKYMAWETGERPLPFDGVFAQKPMAKALFSRLQA